MPDALQINAAFPPKMAGLFRTHLDDGTRIRYKVLYGGRGAGRSWGVSRAALLCGMGGGPAGQLPDGLRTLCVREIQDSLRQSMKRTLADQVVKLQLADYYEVLDESIRGRKGTTAKGTEFFFEGLRRNTSKIKSYEGIDLCIAEEAAPISDNSWKDLTPTIRKPPPGGPFKTGAEFWINFNPELEEDETYQRFIVNPPVNALCMKMNYQDNPWFPEELLPDMAADKARSIDLYNHVWLGECKLNLEGAVYADEMRDVQSENRITEVDWIKTEPVTAVFDLGRSDYTTIWFVQRAGWDFRVIGYYQNNRKHISHYLEVIQRKGYLIDTLWLPHDAQAKTVGTKQSVEEQVKAAGYSGQRCRIVPRLSVHDGIQAARGVFPRCYFDRAATAEGVRHLRLYSYEMDPTTKRFSDKPLHDKVGHSDAADAFRYFAIISGMRTHEVKLNLGPPGQVQGSSMTQSPGGFASALSRLRGLGGNGTGWLGN